MLKYKVKRKNLVKIYFAFIRPVMEYSDVVWDNCTEKDSWLLEDVQVEAGRIITWLQCNSSRTKLYDELGWDLLQTRRKVHKLILFYKIINGYSPNYLYDLIEPYRQSNHSYNLRTQHSSHLILVPCMPRCTIQINKILYLYNTGLIIPYCFYNFECCFHTFEQWLMQKKNFLNDTSYR